MAISIDWPNKVIFVPKADMLQVQSSPTEIRQLDLNEFRLTLRALEDDDGGMPFERTHQHNTTVTVGGVTLARVVEIINDYTVTFEDGQYAVNLVNANSNVGDRVNVNQVSVRSANSAGLVNLNELRSTAYTGGYGFGVHVDPDRGTDNNVYPYGTRATPCKTEQNFMDLTDSLGVRNVYVVRSLVLQLSHSHHEHIFYGDSPQAVNVHCDAPSDVSNCKFQDLYVTGKLDSGNIIERCIVGSITNANGFLYESGLLGPITISGNTSIENCFIAPTAPGQEVILDFDGQAVSVIVGDWAAGRILVKNMVTGSFLGVTGAGGVVSIDPSCTGGDLAYGGSSQLEEDNIDLLDSVNHANNAAQVWEHSNALSFSTFLGVK